MRTLAITLLFAASACGSSQSEPTKPPPGKVGPKMEDHFSAIVSIHEAVTRGELEKTRALAQAFTVTLTDAAHPNGWHPYLQEVRKSLFIIVRSADVETAAKATARAGQACGACHSALGVETLDGGATPPTKRPADLSEYMWQHLFASESMWIGLIGPSEEAWRDGANSLANAGLFPESKDVELTDEMRGLAEDLNDLGTQAIGVAAGPGRSELYGQFLATCAGCHSKFLDKTD